jgi:two-component system sensor histidine kinase ChvG
LSAWQTLRRWRPRRPSRIAVRLLLFNVLLVFLPVAGLFSVRSLELQLLDLQERSMVQQGRLVASALSEDAGGVSPERAKKLVERLAGRSEARIRIVDSSGKLLADSAAAPSPRVDVKPMQPYAGGVSRKSLLYRIGVTLWRPFAVALDLVRRSSETSSSTNSSDSTPRSVIRKALEGRYGATVGESAGQRSLTLYSALPILSGSGGDVIGVVVVSQSTTRILRALGRVRLDIFEVFVMSVAVAIVVSLLVSATIARPLIRLRDEADDLLDHRGRLRKTFGGSHRRDEIGDLTRALERLTGRLERHLAFVEGFSADVSHEFKNPLASIRSAAELLAATDDQQQREQLGSMIEREIGRLNRLLNGVREVSRIDAALDGEMATSVDVRPLLSELLQPHAPATPDGVRFELSLPVRPVPVAASADRLMQAFGNIVNNAISFSPPDGRVAVSVHEHDGFAIIRVDDEGPGIPPEHIERVFDRFFSFRPDGADDRHEHDGLGLAIARAVADGYGGSIAASNLQPRGTRIEVRLPIARG